MILGVDGRSLVDVPISGVGEYAQNLLATMAAGRHGHDYRIFCGRKKHASQVRLPGTPELRSTRLPSKATNSLLVLGLMGMERLVGEVDHFFLPNHIFFSRRQGVPYTVTVHDLSFQSFGSFYSAKGRAWHKAVRPLEIYRKAKNVIAVSESTRRDLVSLAGIPEDRIEVVHSGIGEEFLNFRPGAKDQELERKYSLPARYLLYLGTVEKRKNVAGIVRAFELIKQGPGQEGLRLLIAGKPGYGSREVQKMAKASQFSEDIRFLGYVDPSDKPYLYSRAAAFVYPSFYEGFGFPPLEAMAVGTPVVASNVASLPEVAGDGAVLVDPYNVGEIASALGELLRNGQLAAIMRQKGLDLVQRYTWHDCAKKTLRILER